MAEQWVVLKAEKTVVMWVVKRESRTVVEWVDWKVGAMVEHSVAEMVEMWDRWKAEH